MIATAGNIPIQDSPSDVKEGSGNNNKNKKSCCHIGNGIIKFPVNQSIVL